MSDVKLFKEVSTGTRYPTEAVYMSPQGREETPRRHFLIKRSNSHWGGCPLQKIDADHLFATKNLKKKGGGGYK
jgi:hypothetical protein